MSTNSFSKIRKFLLDNLGLEFSEKRDKEILSKLSFAAPEFGFKDTDSFTEWLLVQNLTEKQAELLATFLTIGETYFFRETKALHFLEFEYLPKLISERQHSKQLKIWSAGCSSGEEPYSIAIILNRIIPDIKNWKITLLATDINSNFLKKAKQGVYTNWSFRNTSEEFKKKYFEKIGNNRFKINDWIQKRVTFKTLNLATDSFPSYENDIQNLDVILCRNVLIYFSQTGIQNVISKFYKTLKNNGVLLVSPVEASSVLDSEFSLAKFDGASIFKKDLAKTNLFLRKESSQIRPFPDVEKIKPILFNKTASIEPVNSIKVKSNGNIEKGKEVYSPEMKYRGPVEEDLDIQKVRELANIGSLEQAEKLCRQIIQKEKLNEAAYYLLATINIELNKNNDAISLLEKVIFLNPDFILAHFTLGQILLKTNSNLASKHFNNALRCIRKQNHDKIIEGSDGLTASDLKDMISSAV